MHLLLYGDNILDTYALSPALTYATFIGAGIGYLALIFAAVTQGEANKLKRRVAALEARIAGLSEQ